MKVKTTLWDTAEHLHNEAEIDAYLAASFEDGDVRQITMALNNALRARRRIASVARETGRDRAGLYRALSGGTDPRFSTILKIAGACGGRIAFIPN